MDKFKTYLGDGCYVELDERGYVKLMTGSHISPDNTIYMEPEVLTAFENWLKQLKGGDEDGQDSEG